MSTKRKISVRKIIQVALTIVVSAGCIVAMVSAARIEGNEKISNVAIRIRNEKKYHFIEQKEIMDLVINERDIDITNTTLANLDIHSMERTLLADPWVAAAEVYVDNARVLNINVTQRVPVARIFGQNDTSYYLDTTLSAMPLSKNFIYYTTVVTNVPRLQDDSAGTAIKKQIVTMARAIQADSFWNAQVSEVIVDSDLTFEFTPVLGNQQIVFGDLSNMKEKFSNLFVFYKDVLNRIGWDKYDRLDVRFNGQVIASPSLPYKGPVDKAVVTMNWINSMVAAGDDGAETEQAAAPIATSAVTATPKVVAKSPVKIVAPKQTPQTLAAHPVKQTVKPAAAKKDVPKKKVGDKSKPKKAVVKKAAAKPGKDTKDKTKDSKGSNTKQAAPKYVYPEKKDH
jgi:cell division protein FtsQ